MSRSPVRRAPDVPRSRLRSALAAAVGGLVLVVLAAFVAAGPVSAAGSLFGDDFESGDLSRWTSVAGLTVQQDEVFAGSWAARGISSGTGTSAMAQRSLATAQPDVTVGLQVKVVSIGGVASVNFVKLRTASGVAIAELYINPGRVLGFRNDVTAVSTAGQTALPLGTWTRLDFRVAVNGTSSTIQVLMDGVPVPGLSTTTASLGTTPVGRVQLGENLTGRVYDMAYDDVAVDVPGATPTSTAPTTTVPSTTTAPSTTASSTTPPTTTAPSTTTLPTTTAPTLTTAPTTTASPTPTATRVFGDDFESGDLSRWTSVAGLTVQQQEVFAGAWAARGTSSGAGTSAQAQRSLSSAQPDLTVGLRLKVVSIGGTSSVNFVKLRTAAGTAIAELFITPARLLGFRNDVTAVSTTSQTALPQGSWRRLDFRVAVNGASSTVQVLLDGVPVPGLSTTTASLGTTPVGRVQLGENLTGRVYDIAYDDLGVDVPAATPTTTTSTPTSTATTTSTSPTPPPSADPVLAAAGDIACDPLDRNYRGTDPNSCREGAVAQLIAADPSVTAVAALGDVQYECGGLAAFQQSYDSTWGALKGKTRPAVGNHEYIASSATATDCDPTATAAGYFTYFGASAGQSGKGYYSYDLGTWHVVVLNTTCEKAGGCGPGSPQEVWLRQDLAAHPAACTLAYFHIPYWSSGTRDEPNAKTFTQDLVAAHADVILTGHDHIYERFGLQNASGVADPNGVRAFVVGTGGKNHTYEELRLPNSEVINHNTFGFLKLALHPGSYDWQFVPEPGKAFTDAGTESCR